MRTLVRVFAVDALQYQEVKVYYHGCFVVLLRAGMNQAGGYAGIGSIFNRWWLPNGPMPKSMSSVRTIPNLIVEYLSYNATR